MKKKVLGIALVSLFSLGLIGTVNTNQTNQKKNVEILVKSEARIKKPVNCSLDGDDDCPFWDEGEGEWTVYYND